MRVRAALHGVVMLMLLASGSAGAQVRAWLDRDRVELGETATLNIESNGNATPDYAPLLAEFDLSGHVSRQQFAWTSGRMQARSVHGVVLRPRRTGLLSVPALRVGGARTAQLSLMVTPPAAPRAPLPGGRDVFIQTEADDPDPYVQQSVGWTVRLYALPPLVSGRLDQDAPDGASLQRIGDDVQYRRDVGGKTFQVIERRYLLIPERSGELAMPPARFEGRAVGNVFDRLFGDGQVDLRARAAPRVLTVRPIPAGAPAPWLPLRAATMEYLERPQAARVGEAATFVVRVLADGAGRAQMPPLDMPVPAGAQVFAETAQVDEAVVDGRPRVSLTRRYSVVPTREGRLRIEGPALTWWDVRAGRARVTRMPPIELQARPALARADDAPAADAPAMPTGIPAPATWRGHLPWLGALLAALALVAWGVARRRRARAPVAPPHAVAVRDAGLPLRQALAMGDLGDIEAALRAAAPAGVDLDAIAAMLVDADQRDAALVLRAARWGTADAAEARVRLRSAFARGPRWREPSALATEPLPPLYPKA